MPAANPTVLSLTSAFLDGFLAINAASADTEPVIRAYAQRRPPLVALRTRRARVAARGSVRLRIWCRTIGDTECRVVITGTGTDADGRRIAGARLVLGSGEAGIATVRIGHRWEGAPFGQIRLNVRAADALGNRGFIRTMVRLD